MHDMVKKTQKKKKKKKINKMTLGDGPSPGTSRHVELLLSVVKADNLKSFHVVLTFVWDEFHSKSPSFGSLNEMNGMCIQYAFRITP